MQGVLRQSGQLEILLSTTIRSASSAAQIAVASCETSSAAWLLMAFPFDCGAKTDSRHDQSANCQSRCKTCAPRLRQVILPEVWPLQLMENSKCQGRDENPTRSSRSCASSGVGAIHSRIRRRRRHITDLVKAGIPEHAREESIELCSGSSRRRPSGLNCYGQDHGRDNKKRCRADYAAQAPD
jgi:hypothetical protein